MGLHTFAGVFDQDLTRAGSEFSSPNMIKMSRKKIREAPHPPGCGASRLKFDGARAAADPIDFPVSFSPGSGLSHKTQNGWPPFRPTAHPTPTR